MTPKKKAKAITKGSAKKTRPRKRAAGAGRSSSSTDYKASWKAASDSSRSDAARIKDFGKLTNAICDDRAVLNGMIGVLRDVKTSLDVRLAALAALQAASFATIRFRPCRPPYFAALRALATDPEPEMRNRVLGLLMREQDSLAQKLLLDGLKKPDKALVPPEKALQLLSYDVKASAYPIARRIVEQPPSSDAKAEALRLLAADAKSVGIFEQRLLDKKESPEIRQISAAALQALAPEKLQQYARDIVMDTTESPAVQATSLTALAQFGKEEDLSKDEVLSKRVERIQSSDAAQQIKQSAKQFATKYIEK